MKHPLNQRRGLVIAIGAGALVNTLANPSGAFAKQGSKAVEKIWRTGFLVPRRRPASIDADFLGGFPQGMRERGYIEGRNLAIGWRFADGDLARLPALAAELVQLKADAAIVKCCNVHCTM